MAPRQRKNNSMLPFKKRIPEYDNDQNRLCLRSKKQYARINTQEKTREKRETQEETQETLKQKLDKAKKEMRKYKKKYNKVKKQIKKKDIKTQKKSKQMYKKTMLVQTRSTQSNSYENLLKGKVIIIKGKYKGTEEKLIQKIEKRLCNSGCEWHYALLVNKVDKRWFTVNMLKSTSEDLT